MANKGEIMIRRLLFLFTISFLLVFSYQWPMFDEYGQPDNKIVTSGFGAYRPPYNSVDPHIHAGIDIPEQDFAQILELYIWPIDYAQVIDIGGSHPFEYIKIRHYNYNEDSLLFEDAKSEGSAYRHAEPVCDEYQWLELDDPVAEGWDMFRPNNRHLHLEYREPSSMVDYLNPFTIDELQIDDNTFPTLCSLYIDNTWQGNAEVFCWEFLGSNFIQYYDSVSIGGTQFYRLYLPDESPFNDWDDPHFIITGNRGVRFVIKMFDSPVSAPYHYHLALDTAITDLSGAGYENNPHYGVKFDALTSEDYYRQDAIYHTGNPCTSSWDVQYYRLYPYGTLPSCIYQQSTLETEYLEEGQHCIRVTAQDYDGNRKTGDAHFYIKMSGSAWVDYCRSFDNIPD